MPERTGHAREACFISPMDNEKIPVPLGTAGTIKDGNSIWSMLIVERP